MKESEREEERERVSERLRDKRRHHRVSASDRLTLGRGKGNQSDLEMRSKAYQDQVKKLERRSWGGGSGEREGEEGVRGGRDVGGRGREGEGRGRGGGGGVREREGEGERELRERD